MKEQSTMGCKIEAELYRKGKLVPDKKIHKFMIVKKHEIIKIELKRDKDEK